MAYACLEYQYGFPFAELYLILSAVPIYECLATLLVQFQLCYVVDTCFAQGEELLKADLL